METIGIFEAKTRLSEICERVSKTNEPILITKRGIPLVKIDPIKKNENNQSEIWNLRKKFIKDNGQINDELDIPER